MHRSNTWEEFQTSDLDLSQTGVCPGDFKIGAGEVSGEVRGANGVRARVPQAPATAR